MMDSLDNNILSVVTPTYLRPREVRGLLDDLAGQTRLPCEVILVDGAPPEVTETEAGIEAVSANYPFSIRYVRESGGTAVQRNKGIELAGGRFVAFIDDDVRLNPDFFEKILNVFEQESSARVGGVVGYRGNQFFRPDESVRWRWYRRLGLLKVFEPGRYDYKCGYPINNAMQPKFEGTREVDFMTTACAVWRREVFDSGLRFDPFFRDYGVLEDAHFSLRAAKEWILLQCGDALCEELHSPEGRENRRKIGYKCVVNYYYVFREIAGPLTWSHKLCFWRYQAFEVFRIGASGLRKLNRGDFEDLLGRMEGIWAVILGHAR